MTARVIIAAVVYALAVYLMPVSNVADCFGGR